MFCPPTEVGGYLNIFLKKLLYIFFILLSLTSFSQTSKWKKWFIDTTPQQKAIKHDTNFYCKYPDRFIFSLYTSYRSFEMDMDQNMGDAAKKSTALKYKADANNSSGFEIDYDKFSVALDYKSSPPDDAHRKGKTSYKGLGLSLGGSKWRLESNWRNYKGFYDLNTPGYDTTFKKDTSAYFQNPTLFSNSFKFKFMYFFKNRKFAYNSSYGYTARQMKSAFSWIFVSNLHVNNMHADTSLISSYVRSDYGSYADLNTLKVVGASAGGGASFNLVIWKRFFFNLAFVVGPEIQWRVYGHNTGEWQTRAYLGSAADLRGALGFNNRNFFITINARADYNVYDSGQMNYKSIFYVASTNIGYRFKVKEPRIMKKIRSFKPYQWL